MSIPVKSVKICLTRRHRGTEESQDQKLTYRRVRGVTPGIPELGEDQSHNAEVRPSASSRQAASAISQALSQRAAGKDLFLRNETGYRSVGETDKNLKPTNHSYVLVSLRTFTV